MNVVDSSAWLEYFADGPNADYFAEAIERTDDLLVPSIVVFEVFKRVLQQRSENEAFQTLALMIQGVVVDLDTSIALRAAKLSDEHRLPLADSIILATAQAFDSVLWTQDSDFESLENVRYRKRNS